LNPAGATIFANNKLWQKVKPQAALMYLLGKLIE
jgi:hypothetical protein